MFFNAYTINEFHYYSGRWHYSLCTPPFVSSSGRFTAEKFKFVKVQNLFCVISMFKHTLVINYERGSSFIEKRWELKSFHVSCCWKIRFLTQPTDPASDCWVRCLRFKSLARLLLLELNQFSITSGQGWWRPMLWTVKLIKKPLWVES